MSSVVFILRRYVVKQFQDRWRHRSPYSMWDPAPEELHLLTCPELVAKVRSFDETEDWSAGPHIKFESTVSCPHGFEKDFVFGDYNTLPWIIEDMEKLERDQ